MRVLFVTHNVPRRAGDLAGSFVLRLAEALVHDGHRVEIVAPGEAGLPARHVLNDVVVHRVRYAPDDRMTLAYEGTMVEQVQRSWSGRLAMWGMLRAMRRATRTLLQDAERAGDRFDVVHAHWWFPAGLALWRNLPRRGPGRVVTMHGSDVRLAAHVAPARRLMRSVLAYFDVCTTVSTWLATVAHHAAPASSVVVAPMPVDTDRFHMPHPPTSDERHGILFVGRLNAQKGAADVLSALARSELREATLDIVGTGPDREWLDSQALRSELTNRIRWHGALAPHMLAPMYRRARVVVMPSRDEGLGLVAVEAQLSGTPVVGYASGGLGDVVQPAHGGALVPVGNIAALAQELAKVHDDPVEARRRGALAHAFVVSRFNAARVAQHYLDLYRQAIALRHAGRT